MFEAARVLDELNDEQRRAATHTGGPLLVLAGAGSGKTGTLVARAAWLRQQGTQASRILLLTFTRRAADDMLARVASSTGGAEERICGGTFHAIAHRIIREHAESFSLPPAFSVIDPADMSDVLDSLREEHGLVGTRRRAPRAAVCADIYTRCVNTQTTVADVVRGRLPVVHRLHRAARRACSAATSPTSARTAWSTSTTCCCCGGRRWPTRRPGPALRGLFDAVLVDEYQDVNAVQADIVRLLRPGRVGADLRRRRRPGHLRVPRRRPGAPARAGGAFPGLTVVRLVRNYRSKAGGAAAGQRGAPAVRGLELELTAARAAPGPPRYSCAATTRPRRPARSAPGSWTRTRPGGTSASRRSWCGRRTTATCWR